MLQNSINWVVSLKVLRYPSCCLMTPLTPLSKTDSINWLSSVTSHLWLLLFQTLSKWLWSVDLRNVIIILDLVVFWHAKISEDCWMVLISQASCQDTSMLAVMDTLRAGNCSSHEALTQTKTTRYSDTLWSMGSWSAKHQGWSWPTWSQYGRMCTGM